MSLSRKAGDINPLFVTSFNRFLFLIENRKSLNNSFRFLYVLLLNFMTGTAKPKQLQYGEEDDISMLSIELTILGVLVLATPAKYSVYLIPYRILLLPTI